MTDAVSRPQHHFCPAWTYAQHLLNMQYLWAWLSEHLGLDGCSRVMKVSSCSVGWFPFRGWGAGSTQQRTCLLEGGATCCLPR